MKKYIFYLLLFLILASCSSIQTNIDKTSLNKNKKQILKDFSPGNPADLQSYIEKFDLNEKTFIPKSVELKSVKELTSWHIKTKKDINYEKWTFDSPFYNLDIPGDALFYVMQQKPWENSKVILWIPGFGVSDMAFTFLKRFFTSEIEAGYNIVIYIPPYHMDRQKKGEAAGNGLLSSSPLDNVKKMVNSVKELRTAYRYLENRKVRSISMWGGSMGGAFALMLQSLEGFDHLSLMIPVLDWNSFITPESVLPQYLEAGFDKNLIQAAYALISPVNYKLTIPPEKVQVEAAELDQLNPIDEIKNYCTVNKIKNFSIYPSGHATILLYKDVYRDYEKFLLSLQ
ncbi:MAG: hypothetical protein J7L71_00060 [Spirochaetaceae bacterium]|nr:hypothetical protein [Spirochaetaceae bacterium]